MSYTVERLVPYGFDEAIERVTDALAEQGFGVLTQIDVQATLAAKLGEEFRPYKILGACNPHFAHQALQAEERIGVLLPCNVVVHERPDGEVEVAAVDPIEAMGVVENAALGELAREVRAGLTAALEAL